VEPPIPEARKAVDQRCWKETVKVRFKFGGKLILKLVWTKGGGHVQGGGVGGVRPG